MSDRRWDLQTRLGPSSIQAGVASTPLRGIDPTRI
jgi:hypothetical protein